MEEEDFSEAGKIGAIYLRLKALLVEGKFRPGTRLVADELADRFRVSRTPVREALQRLGWEGIVMTMPNRGYFVKGYDLGEMRNLHQVMWVLLRACLDDPVRGFSQAGLSKPLDLEFGPNGELRTNSEPFMLSHAMFIEGVCCRIAEVGGNGEIIDLVRNLCDRTHGLRLLDLREGPTIRWIGEQMLTWVAALDAGDFATARRSLDEQYAAKLARLPELVEAANREASFAAVV